jgi:exopolysaccharide production protein ExoQ
MTRRLPERLFAAAALFVFSSALFPLLEGVGNSTLVEPPEDLRLTALTFAVYAIALLLLVKRRTRLLGILAANKLLFALGGFAAFSFSWSAIPGTTATKAIGLLLTMMVGVYLATAFPPNELAALVAWLLAGVIVLSVVFAILFPRYGIDHLRGGTWRGVFTTKNELGRIAVLATAVWLVRYACRYRSRLASLFFAGVSILVLERSGSKTGLAVLGFVALFLVLLPALRGHWSIAMPTGAALCAALVLGGIWLVGHSDTVLETLGGNSSLTGRSQIWTAVQTMIGDHAWLGWGFSAFWRGIEGPSGQLWAMVGATPPHSHNGVLDLWLDLGAVGVALFAGSFVVAAWRAWRGLRLGWSTGSVFAATYLCFFALYNVSESTLLHQHSLFWVLYTAVAVQLARPESRRARVPAQRPVPLTKVV